jgi:phenylalanyl-tRNA synthetase beta chain
LLGVAALPTFRALPRQQSAWRDIAVIAGEPVSHAALMQAIDAVPGGLVRSARLFDVYRPAQAVGDIGAGERSLAVRLEIRDDETTLTDERIDAVVGEVLATLQRRLGLRLRT